MQTWVISLNHLQHWNDISIRSNNDGSIKFFSPSTVEKFHCKVNVTFLLFVTNPRRSTTIAGSILCLELPEFYSNLAGLQGCHILPMSSGRIRKPCCIGRKVVDVLNDFSSGANISLGKLAKIKPFQIMATPTTRAKLVNGVVEVKPIHETRDSFKSRHFPSPENKTGGTGRRGCGFPQDDYLSAQANRAA